MEGDSSCAIHSASENCEAPRGIADVVEVMDLASLIQAPLTLAKQRAVYTNMVFDNVPMYPFYLDLSLW